MNEHDLTPSRFNVRVYGIWIHEGRLLVNEEQIHGRQVIKLPGGGLELGEGTIEGLKREWMEELGLEVEVLAHYYTTDFFQPSAFDNSQVISIYYLVAAEADQVICNSEPNERTYWMPLEELSDETFTLPIDRLVGKMLTGTHH
jgi:ADP-ribose pyrophosphatase YjhB (NUDIX family)